jgi:hypothetical protein
MMFGRLGGRIAAFGARAVPAIQKFGLNAGRTLHTGGGIGHMVAQVAKLGLNRLQNNPALQRVPGMGEFLGAARDAANLVDTVAMGASRVGDVAEAVGSSKALSGLTTRFEKAAKNRR